MKTWKREKLNRIVAIFAALAAIVYASHSSAAEQPRAVLELFTSQGCSSCPAADKILGNYAEKGDVLALSYHVDYWNYLGWKDTFSKAEFTDRQQRYALAFHRRGVYTPQAVVNGRDHVVGSRESDIEGLINSYSGNSKGLTVPVKTVASGDNLHVTTDVASGNATLWVVYFDKRKAVKIERGENKGRTITYHNVVRDISMLGMMKQGKLDVTLPLAEMKRKGFEACALLLQQTTQAGTPGPIVGAAMVGDL